jgi:hypothetical protein
MKDKLSTNIFSYSFTPRVHPNVLAWVTPDSVSERSKRAIENILRWEDDGGPMSETKDPLPHVATPLDQPEKTSQMVKEISRK